MRKRVVIVLAVLLATAVGVARADRSEETPLSMPLSLFPMQLEEWRGEQRPPFADDVLKVLGLDDYLTRLYRVDSRTVADLYIGYWRSQRQGDTMHSPQNCLPGSGWEPASQSILTLPDPRDAKNPPISVNRFVIQKGLEKQLVLYWYQSRGNVIGSEYWSKIHLVWSAMRYNRTDAAIVRVVVPVLGTSADAEAAAEKSALRFVNLMMPQLGNFLPN